MFDQVVIHNIYTLSTVEYTSPLQIYDFVAINFIFLLKILTDIIFFNLSFRVSFLELRTLF